MATWHDLTTYVRHHHQIAEEGNGLIKIIFEFDDLRSQMVILSCARLSGGTEEWVQIQSPFAKVGSVDMNRVLDYVGQTVCGGLSRAGEHLTIRHSVPLANLDINEFERPLALVTSTADTMEKMFAGGDHY